MIAMDNGFIFITVFFVASLVQVNALQCWTCSSETELHAEFCGKHFLKNKIPETLEKNGKVFKNCTDELNNNNKKLHNIEETANLIPVCRKKIIKVNDEIFYQRHCDTVDKRAKSIVCKGEKIDNKEVIDCEDCQYDYCNESFITLPQLLHFITPILLAKILLY